MLHIDIVDFSLLSRYFLIFAIFIMLINIAVCSYFYIFRRNVLRKKETKPMLLNNGFVLIMLVVIGLAIFAFQTDLYSIIFGPALLLISLVISYMHFWGYSNFLNIAECSMEMLEVLVGVIEAGDENLDGHSLHVQNLTMLMYDYLPTKYRININPLNLQFASLLLDVGKLGVPRSIINKSGKLTPEERSLIQKHPEICVDLFKKLPSFNIITKWIKYHHERVDGEGYYHLKGTEIPLASRILAVADTYSALTMDRSYKASIPYESAISEMRLVAGSQLDAELVAIFCSIPRQKVTSCMDDVHTRMKKYQIGDFRSNQ